MSTKKYKGNTKAAAKPAGKLTKNQWIAVVCAAAAVIAAVVLICVFCGGGASGYDFEALREKYANVEKPVATITMENGDVIELELYPAVAPNTVANFVTLANSGYYDGLTFHRVIRGFMIQGGDPNGDGSGGPGYSIRGEFTDNGCENDLLHERGVISMARANDPDSAGSQFFIMHMNAPHLNGLYAAFGRVTSGMEAVDKIASVKTNPRNDMPLEAQVIATVRVDTKGVEYKVVKK